MSYLKINQLLKKAEGPTFQVHPTSTCIYEDYLRSKDIDAYTFLNMSNERENLNHAYEENIDIYIESLQDVLKKHKTLTYVNTQKPLSFAWNILGQEYTSTSLFFEYYMAHLMRVVTDIKNAITKKQNNAILLFKQTKKDILHMLKILPSWKTTKYVQPHPPIVANKEFLKQLLYFCHATQGMYSAFKSNRPHTALNTACTYYGKMWFRMPVFGIIAQNHYLLCKSTLYNGMAAKVEVEDSEKKYLLLQKTKEYYNLVAFKHCHTLDAMKENHEMIENNEAEIRTLEQVYYVTGSYDTNSLEKLPVIELKICPKTSNFGCKCSKNNDQE